MSTDSSTLLPNPDPDGLDERVPAGPDTGLSREQWRAMLEEPVFVEDGTSKRYGDCTREDLEWLITESEQEIAKTQREKALIETLRKSWR
jgi:hypothetical protein